MRKKGGIKLLFALIAVVGGGFALSACNSQINNSGPEVVEPTTPPDPTLSINPTDPTIPSDPTDPINPTDPTTPTDVTDEGNEEQKKLAERINLEIQIEDLLSYKINERLEEEAVSNVDAKYFTIKDNAIYGQTFETYGLATMAETGEQKQVVLGLPLTSTQYSNFNDLQIPSTEVVGDLYQNYSNEQLSYTANYVKDSNLTYSYAMLDGRVWDLDAMSPTKIEKSLEEKYANLVKSYFMKLDNREVIKSVDLKYVETIDNGYYGDTVCFVGTSTLTNEKVKSFEMKVCPSAENYQLVKNTLTSNASNDKDMAENYTREEMFCLYSVVNDETTASKSISIDGNLYVLSSFEEENKL